MLVALEHISILGFEHVTRNIGRDELGNLLVGRPDVLQVHVLTIGAFADWLFGEILGYRAGECVCDNQRRRSQVVGLHIGTDATFEVAIT